MLAASRRAGSPTVTDEIIDLHDRIIGKLFAAAKNKHHQQFQASDKATNNKVRFYARIGQALLDVKQSGSDPFAAIDGSALDGQCDERGIAPLRLELGQIGGRHLTALAGDLEQPVLMNLMLDTGRQVKRLPSFEAVDMLAHDDEDLLRYLSPLGWKHINLTGDYLWRSSAKITGGRFKPLWPMAGA